MDTLDTGYLGYLCIADTAVLQIQANIKYCICIHGYVRIHVPPGDGKGALLALAFHSWKDTLVRGYPRKAENRTGRKKE